MDLRFRFGEAERFRLSARASQVQMQERADEYVPNGNRAAVNRILSHLEATPFLSGEIARLQTELKEEAKTYGREN